LKIEMATLKLLFAGLFASAAFASPWNRNPNRGNERKKHNAHHNKGWGTTTDESPPGYETTSAGAGWGYGSTSVCLASTVTETPQPSTVRNRWVYTM
jgi:hypothetical protein